MIDVEQCTLADILAIYTTCTVQSTVYGTSNNRRSGLRAPPNKKKRFSRHQNYNSIAQYVFNFFIRTTCMSVIWRVLY